MSGIAGMPEFAGHAQMAPREATERDRVVRAIGLAVVAGAAGVAGWIAVGVATSRELGLVAVGVGLLVGFAASRARASSAGLPFVAATVALVAVLVGDLALAVVLQARSEGAGVGRALLTTVTTPAVARDLVAAIGPVDLLFWALAAVAAFRQVSAASAAARATRTHAGGPPVQLYIPRP